MNIAVIVANIDENNVVQGFQLDRDPETKLIRRAQNNGERQQTLTIMSAFSNSRADEFADLPQSTTDRKGYWGDFLLPAVAGIPFELGSKLWTLGRTKALEEVAETARIFLEEALQWKFDTGEILTLDVVAQRNGERLELAVTETTPEGTFEQSFLLDWSRRG